jgi:hypothetical protein
LQVLDALDGRIVGDGDDPADGIAGGLGVAEFGDFDDVSANVLSCKLPLGRPSLMGVMGASSFWIYEAAILA